MVMVTARIAKDIIGRMVALFLVSATGVITGAAVFAPNLSIGKSCLLAGTSAVVQVLQKLATAAMDGKISQEEVDAAFGVKSETRAAANEAKGISAASVENPGQ